MEVGGIGSHVLIREIALGLDLKMVDCQNERSDSILVVFKSLKK